MKSLLASVFTADSDPGSAAAKPVGVNVTSMWAELTATKSLTRSGLVVDTAIATATLLFALAALIMAEPDRSTGELTAAYIGVVLGSGALIFRRRNPALALLVVVVARFFVTFLAGVEPPLSIAAVIALFSCTYHSPRKFGIGFALACGVSMALMVSWLDNDYFWTELAGEGAQMLLPVAVGDALRGRVERITNMIEVEAERRVHAERLRIARDLHDVVAHGLSTISIQSGVAVHLFDRDPNQAKEALEVINTTGKSALEELRAMVGVLRSADDAPLQPTPVDPDDLAELVAFAQHNGLQLDMRVEGAFPEDVGDSCIIAVHRIISEALTNVVRHAGPVVVELTVNHGDGDVAVTIENHPPDPAAPVRPTISTGVGILGMRERADSLGGGAASLPGQLLTAGL